jgi:hypothetical protein
MLGRRRAAEMLVGADCVLGGGIKKTRKGTSQTRWFPPPILPGLTSDYIVYRLKAFLSMIAPKGRPTRNPPFISHPESLAVRVCVESVYFLSKM